MRVSLRCRQPWGGFANYIFRKAQFKGPGQLEKLARLVIYKAKHFKDEMAKISDNEQLEEWLLIPADLLEQSRYCAAKLALRYQAQYQIRVLDRTESLPLQLLLVLKSPPDTNMQGKEDSVLEVAFRRSSVVADRMSKVGQLVS